MVQRSVHYEAAFEDFVRSRGWPYVAVNEHRKAIFNGRRIKSFDFLVYRPESDPWLVEVKGRKFPYDYSGGVRYWENWVTQEDLDDLARWQPLDFFADAERAGADGTGDHRTEAFLYKRPIHREAECMGVVFI